MHAAWLNALPALRLAQEMQREKYDESGGLALLWMRVVGNEAEKKSVLAKLSNGLNLAAAILRSEDAANFAVPEQRPSIAFSALLRAVQDGPVVEGALEKGVRKDRAAAIKPPLPPPVPEVVEAAEERPVDSTKPHHCQVDYGKLRKCIKLCLERKRGKLAASYELIGEKCGVSTSVVRRLVFGQPYPNLPEQLELMAEPDLWDGKKVSVASRLKTRKKEKATH